MTRKEFVNMINSKNVKQGKDGYYRAWFYYNDRQYSGVGTTAAHARIAAIDKYDAFERGESGKSNKLTVKAWGKTWLKVYKQGLQDKSYRNVERHVDVIISHIGNMKLKDVNASDLKAIFNLRDAALKESLKEKESKQALNEKELKLKKDGYSISEKTHLTQTIKGMFRDARIDRKILFNPAEELKVPDGTEGKRRSITEEERAMILKTAEHHYAGMMFKLMLYTGLRSSEVTAVTWGDIDLSRGIVDVNKAMDDKGNIKEPKTKAGYRNVPIVDLGYIAELSKMKTAALAGVIDIDFNTKSVFTQVKTGKRHIPKSFQNAWKNFVRCMDIDNGAVVVNNQIVESVLPDGFEITPYYLRHSYCTDLEKAGVPINKARYLMGHENISITSKIYTHTTVDQNDIDMMRGIGKAVNQ